RLQSAEGREPRLLVKMGLPLDTQALFRCAARIVHFIGHHAKTVIARRQIGVIRDAALSGVRPILVEAFHTKLEPDPVGRPQADRCVMDFELTSTRGEYETL